MSDVVRPLLKYPGGKRKVALPLLRKLGGDRKVLIDLCCGAGAYLHAAHRLGYTTLRAADASPLIQAWWGGSIPLRWAGRLFNPAHEHLANTGTDEMSREFYMILREAAPNLAPSQIYMLNRAGYNGLSRFNKKGKYNVPYGKVTSIPSPSPTDLAEHFKVAEKIQVFVSSYEYLLSGAYRPDEDAVYVLDPPYLGGFTAYTPFGWGVADLVDVLERLRTTLRPGDVAIIHEHTGGEAQEIIEERGAKLYATWNRSGTISCDINNRTPRQEGVWILEAP